MKLMTLSYPIKAGHVLLGLKQRGLGKGKWNGFGGHVESGEAAHVAAIRELREESGLVTKRVEHVGTLDFIYEDCEDLRVQVFLVKAWTGEIRDRESEEMAILDWWNMSELPFDQMWPDDQHWLPLALDGWHVYGRFFFFKGDKLYRIVLTMDKP